MTTKYSISTTENHAKAFFKSLPISTKQSVEISSFIRGKATKNAKKLLEQVLKHKIAVPFKRFNRDLAHKPGIAAGRYPEKAINYFTQLLAQVEKNAEEKGLDIENLFIKHMAAHKASRPFHHGRHIRRKMKRTHLEIVVESAESSREVRSATKASQADEVGHVTENKKTDKGEQVAERGKTKDGGVKK